MAETLLDSGPVLPGLDVPTFAPRKGVLLREYHVLVRWADGRRVKVGRFSGKPDAQCWIKQKSTEWLTEFHTAENSN